MRLKSVTLHGFKSFANKTQLDFTKSVTAVVGPNGSGKSNIVEAIRFVLGEQSTKSMRGGNISDLIFSGSVKMNYARVSMVFDNADRVFKLLGGSGAPLLLDYDQIEITREIYKDGSAQYLLNGTKVRLKDLVELLASVHIGSSSHQIISQGSADRLLHASASERREMIEDALGLKIHRLKLKEARRKLDRSKNHAKEVEALQNELKPYLAHLDREMRRIEKGKILRESLVFAFCEYQAGALVHIEEMATVLRKKEIDYRCQKTRLEQDCIDIQDNVTECEKLLQSDDLSVLQQKQKEVFTKLQVSQKRVTQMQSQFDNHKNAINQGLQSIKQLAGNMDRLVFEKEKASSKKVERVVFEDYKLEEFLKHVLGIKNAIAAGGIEGIKKMFQSFDKFLKKITTQTLADTTTYDIRISLLKTRVDEEKNRLEKASLKKVELDFFISKSSQELQVLQKQFAITEGGVSRWQSQQKDSIRMLQDFQSQFRSTQTKLLNTNHDLEVVHKKRALLSVFEEEVSRDFLHIKQLAGDVFFNKMIKLTLPKIQKTFIDRLALVEERKQIERLLIRFEHIGFNPSPKLEEEHQQAVDREAFLQKELEDIRTASSILVGTTLSLQDQLVSVFNEGVLGVQSYFSQFVAQMFGGGSAALDVVSIEKLNQEGHFLGEDTKNQLLDDRGVEVRVDLPKKSIKRLSLLSGGERSLVSIALLFALAHINPPPFLILDETDAALDEANSRRYGAMIRYVAKTTQLVVVTHNRETMSQADMLFGITMGQRGVSQTVHVDMEKAISFAK